MAHITEPHVRETSGTTLTADFVLAGAMRQSLAFGDVMATGDTCDYVAMYDNTFEEGLGTMGADGKLQRPATTYRSLHANGTIDTNPVSFASGIKTIIMSYGTPRVADLVTLAAKAVRADQAQSLSVGEQAQARANAPPFAGGTAVTFHLDTAPVGWTKFLSHHDKALRVTTGAVTAGGSVDFSTCFARTATDAFTLSQANLPSVNFSLTVSIADSGHATTLNNATNIINGAGGGTSFGGGPVGTAVNITANTAATGVTASGTAASGGSATAKTAGMDIRVKYVDVIIAIKD